MEIVMVHLVLMFFGLLSFVGPVFGSEKNDEITIFKANIGTLNANPLRYCDKEYIDFLNNHYDMQCKYNEPFLRVYHPWVREEQQDLQNTLVKPITFVPFRYFMNDNTDPRNSNVCFKKRGAELLSCSRLFIVTKNKFQIKLTSDFGEMDPKALLEQFKKTPRCEPGNIYNEKGRLLVFIDTEDLEKELCEAGIIRSVGKFYGYGHLSQLYEQWINGYFGDEIKAEQEEMRAAEEAERSVLLYSRLKKLFAGSIAAIIMYVLYKQFYK
jgi:hypothetical protein